MSQPFRRGLFNRIELSIGHSVDPAAATPEHLESLVRSLCKKNL